MEQLNHKGTKTQRKMNPLCLSAFVVNKGLQVIRIERVALAHVSGLVAFFKPA